MSTRYQLSNDIEKNPGPSILYVDPSKTIQAPYSQADVVVIGQNARQQCVTVSVYLIYHNMKGKPGELKQLMHIRYHALIITTNWITNIAHSIRKKLLAGIQCKQ